MTHFALFVSFNISVFSVIDQAAFYGLKKIMQSQKCLDRLNGWMSLLQCCFAKCIIRVWDKMNFNCQHGHFNEIIANWKKKKTKSQNFVKYTKKKASPFNTKCQTTESVQGFFLTSHLIIWSVLIYFKYFHWAFNASWLFIVYSYAKIYCNDCSECKTLFNHKLTLSFCARFVWH